MYKFLGGGISRNVGNGISGISRTATARNFVHHAGNRSAGVWELKTGERIYAVGFARLTKFCHQFLLTRVPFPLVTFLYILESSYKYVYVRVLVSVLPEYLEIVHICFLSLPIVYL